MYGRTVPYPKSLGPMMLLLVLTAVADACVRKSQTRLQGDVGSSLSQLLQESDPVRIGFLDVAKPTLVMETLDSLIASKNLVSLQDTQEADYSREVFRTINFAAKAKFGLSQDQSGHFIRRDAFALQADLKPMQIVGKLPGQVTLPLSFTLAGGSSIESLRIFESRAKAVAASPFDLLSLPLTAAKAREMKTGEVYIIPIHAKFLFDVNGQFLTDAWKHAPSLTPFIQAGSLGTLQGSLQGHLVAEGQVNLHVVRLEGRKIRVRYASERTTSVQGQGKTGVDAALRFSFVPLSKFGRVAELKKLSNVDLTDVKSKLMAGRVGLSLAQLPEGLKNLGQVIAQDLSVKDDGQERLFRDALDRSDEALEIAQKLAENAESLQSKTTGRVNAAIDALNANVVGRYNSVHDTVKKYTDSTVDLAATVQLEGSFSQKIRLLADYVFDLDNPLAGQAYERAVSGRATYLTPAALGGASVPNVTSALNGSLVPGTEGGPLTGTTDFLGRLAQGNIFDLTMAERIAVEDQKASTTRPRVVRGMQVYASLREANMAVQFDSPFFSLGFQQNSKRNRLRAIDSKGNVQAFYGAIWKFDSRLLMFGQPHSSEARSSGFLVPSDGSFAAQDLGAYWYSWEKTFPDFSSESSRNPLVQSLNVLGPLGFRLGLPAHVTGESTGRLKARLDVMLLEKTLARFFDPKVTTEAILWQALGNLAETFDNTFGLPFLAFPLGMPARIAGTPAQAHCQRVAKQWGIRYCQYFANEFIPEFQEAQQSGDVAKKMSFFEKFYKKGFLANKIGADVMMRLMFEIANIDGVMESANDIALRIELTNEGSESDGMHPAVTYGDSRALSLVEIMGFK